MSSKKESTHDQNIRSVQSDIEKFFSNGGEIKKVDISKRSSVPFADQLLRNNRKGVK